MSRSFVEVTFVICISHFLVPSQVDNDAAADKKGLQGRWECVEAIAGGKARPKNELVELIFSQDTMESIDKGGDKAKKSFTLDTAKKPRKITLTELDPPVAGKTSIAIYELNGDMLKLCYSDNPKAPPEKLASPDGSRIMLMTFKRKTKD